MDAGREFEREIGEQPSLLERLREEAAPEIASLAERIRRYDPVGILIAARGSSDNAARYAQYLFGVRHRHVVALAVPSATTLYGVDLDLRRWLVFGVSQSGRSPDVVTVLESAHRQGALTVAFTNDLSSPLALSAEHAIGLRAGDERAVAASKTYTAELMLFAMLSAALNADEKSADELRVLPELCARALSASSMDGVVESLKDTAGMAVIGRSFNYATAFEIALKLKETSYIVAEAYSTADFRHGPLAIVSARFPVVLVAMRGPTLADAEDFRALLMAKGAHVITISNEPSLLEGSSVGIALPIETPEWLSPVVAVLPGQRLALALARWRGHDPDAPRGLKKVTETR